MSWLHLLGEDWPATQNAAEVKLHLWRSDSLCPRQEWSLELTHRVPRLGHVHGTPGPTEKALVLTLGTLGFDLRDWRELAGKELRSDAAWHDQHDACNECGWPVETSLEAWEMVFYDPVTGQFIEMRERTWRAHEFVIRFGQRDGFSFPMELEAWLIPEDKFWQRAPESPADLTRFGEGPPHLRIMATAYFTDGWVCLPACTDPLALARRTLRETIAFEGMHDAEIQWASRSKLGTSEQEDRPDWPPTVHYRTEPGRPRHRRGTREE